MHRIFGLLLWCALALALTVVVLGAWTRLSDAGLGCPDWPGCYGQMLVPDQVSEHEYQRPLVAHKAWKEMIHRYAAGALGTLIVIIFCVGLAAKIREGKPVLAQALLLGTVVFQALLGMWTVTHLLNPLIVTAHLLGGFATLSLLWWLILRQSQQNLALYQTSPQGLKIAALLALLLVITQITLGGWTSTNYAALACGASFPGCQGVWWPPMDFANAFNPHWQPGTDYEYGILDSSARTAIQMTHRIGALTVLLYLGTLVTRLLVKPVPRVGRLPVIIAALLILQVTLGILNIKLGLPMALAVLHNLAAALLLLAVITLNYRVLTRQ